MFGRDHLGAIAVEAWEEWESAIATSASHVDGLENITSDVNHAIYDLARTIRELRSTHVRIREGIDTDIGEMARKLEHLVDSGTSSAYKLLSDAITDLNNLRREVYSFK